LQVPYRREIILPTGRIELMINFGPPHRKYDQDQRRFQLMTDSWIAGFQTEYIVNEPVANTHMMGVRFKPGGAFPFFAEPIQEFSNFVIDMDAVWGRRIAEIRERLLTEPTRAGRFQLLEKILYRQLQKAQSSERFIAYAVQQLLQTRGLSSTKNLSEEIGVSQKHLIHKFKHEVGVTPKQFGRVLKLQAVLKQIEPRSDLNWSDIALQANYYDQAHFNRDFRRFSGLTPAAYVNFRRTFFGPEADLGENVHFVPIR
jgi:AraC-like DNA-binding protein